MDEQSTLSELEDIPISELESLLPTNALVYHNPSQQYRQSLQYDDGLVQMTPDMEFAFTDLSQVIGLGGEYMATSVDESPLSSPSASSSCGGYGADCGSFFGQQPASRLSSDVSTAAAVRPTTVQSRVASQQHALLMQQTATVANKRGRKRIVEPSTAQPASKEEERRQRRRASNRRAAERYREKMKASADDIRTEQQQTKDENSRLRAENDLLRRQLDDLLRQNQQLQQQLQQQIVFNPLLLS